MIAMDSNQKRVEVFVEANLNNDQSITGWCVDAFHPRL